MFNQTIDISARPQMYSYSSGLGMMDNSGMGSKNILNNIRTSIPFTTKSKNLVVTSRLNLKKNKKDESKKSKKYKPKVTTNLKIKKTKSTKIEESDDDDYLLSEGPSLTALLKEHELLIKYKKGCPITNKLKINLKKGAYNRFVKFKLDKKLNQSPTYYLDDEETFFKGYLTKELLRHNILEQLEIWGNENDISSDEESEDDDDDDDEDEDDEEIGLNIETSGIKEKN